MTRPGRVGGLDRGAITVSDDPLARTRPVDHAVRREIGGRSVPIVLLHRRPELTDDISV
jgi:hypothetical protein